MKRICSLVLALAISPCASAAGVAELVRKAVDQGAAEGAVDDAVAKEAAAQLHATGELRLRVTRLWLMQQPGCARVRLAFTQQDAMVADQRRPAPYRWTVEMSVCSDGQAPVNTRRRTK